MVMSAYLQNILKMMCCKFLHLRGIICKSPDVVLSKWADKSKSSVLYEWHYLCSNDIGYRSSN